MSLRPPAAVSGVTALPGRRARPPRRPARRPPRGAGAAARRPPSRAGPPAKHAHRGRAAAARCRTVDPEATRAGLRVLRRGGNAVDAAVRRGRDPRGHRAVLHGHRRRRLLRVLRRQGAARSAPSTAARPRRDVDHGRHLPRPHVRRGGQQRALGRRPRHARAPGPRALRRWGTAQPGEALAAGRPGGPPRLRRRPDLPRPDRRQRGAVPRHHADPRAVPARRRSCRRRLGVPQPATWPTPTTRSAARASAGSTTASSAARSSDTVQQPPKDPASTRNVRPGLMTRADLARYRRRVARADQRRLPRARRSGAWPRRPAAGRRSARR